MSFHIQQYYYLYRSFSDFSRHTEKDPRFYFHAQKINIPDLLEYKRLFIVGEPGHGKTTLVENLKSYLNNQNLSFNYFNGNDFEGLETLEKQPYLIFDALDECKNFVLAYKQILNYADENNTKLIVSTRSHYISDIENLVENLDFFYAQILPFDNDQITEFLFHYLAELSFTEENIKSILLKSFTGSGISVLRVPRYLNEFKNYIVQNKVKVNQTIQFTKSELFEKVVYFKLESVHKNSNKTFLIKRVLERLSLLMEIFEVNQLPKEDFITFLDQTQSNINLVFLSNIKIDKVLNRDLKSIGKNILFEHTEFQEYLAAKEILRLGNKYQTIFDLMVEPTLKVIPSNWIDVLSFAIDMDHQIINPLLAFIRSVNFQNIDEKLIKMMLNVPVKDISQHTRKEVFRVAFDYYNKTGRSVYDMHNELAIYANVPGTRELRPMYTNDEIKPAIRHNLNNQIFIIESLAKDNQLDESNKAVWIRYLKELIKNEDLFAIRSSFFYALIALEANEALLDLEAFFVSQPDYIFNDYIYALSRKMPDHKVTIKLIFDSLLRNRRIDNMETILGNISEPKNLILLFNFLTINPQVINSNTSWAYADYYSLFKNCRDSYSPSVGSAMEKFAIAALSKNNYAGRLSKLVSGTIKVLLTENIKVINKLLKIDKAYYWLGDMSTDILECIDLKAFKKIEKYFVKHRALWNFNGFIHNAKDKYEEDTDSKFHQYIEKKYFSKEKIVTTTSPNLPVAPDVLTELRGYYLSESGYYHTGLIPFFVNKHKELKGLLEQSDMDYITGVINTVLSGYDPDKFTVELEKYEPNRTTFSHNSDVWFGIQVYFKAAYLLGGSLILNQYREKLLKTIPRLETYNSDDSENFRGILNQLGEISDAEITMLLNFCNSRTDHYLLLSVRTFSESIRALNLKAFKPLLKKFTLSNVVHLFERDEALKVFGEMAENKDDLEFLQNTFSNYLNLKVNLSLVELANAYMITKFLNEPAIAWRFNELKTRMKDIDLDHRYNGARSVSSYESEIDRPEFGKCFYGLKNDIIQASMIDLLYHSFTIRTNRLHLQYSSYLQRIVYEYFESILDSQSLNALNKAVNKFKETELTYSFSNLLLQLTTAHHINNQKNKTFLDAILKYNNLLQKAYLKIASNEDLKDALKLILERDITRLIEDEGFYRVSNQLSGETYKKSSYINEELIQKTLKIAFEKALLENSFRKVDILREVETYEGLKYDYIINYGLYGPIVVELKLLHNKEIQNKQKRLDYKEKLKKYIQANNNLGLYVIFQTRDLQSHVNNFDQLKSSYNDINGLEIIKIKCF